MRFIEKDNKYIELTDEVNTSLYNQIYTLDWDNGGKSIILKNFNLVISTKIDNSPSWFPDPYYIEYEYKGIKFIPSGQHQKLKNLLVFLNNLLSSSDPNIEIKKIMALSIKENPERIMNKCFSLIDRINKLENKLTQINTLSKS